MGPTPTAARPAIHFRGLNELRFLAAFAVIVHHIEVNKYRLGYESLVEHPLLGHFVTHLGQVAVSSFFVLSGFLMTFLLLEEQRVSGGIRVSAFYARRILRIWPLYFLTVGIGFGLMPTLAALPSLPSLYTRRIIALEHHWGGALVLFLLMLPNLAIRLYSPILGASHAWSIGVEEQFYAIWPWFMRWFRRYLVRALLALVGIKFALQALLYAVSTAVDEPSVRAVARLAYLFLSALWIENMAIGGLGACALVAGVTPVLFGWPQQLAALAAMLLVSFVSTGSELVDHLLEPIAFTVLMMNLALNPHPLFRLDSPRMSRLGQISYGLYMFHPAVVVVTMTLLITLFPYTSMMFPRGVASAMVYGTVLPVTWLISRLSYRYFESPFLALKPSYSVVVSQPEAPVDRPAPVRGG